MSTPFGHAYPSQVWFAPVTGILAVHRLVGSTWFFEYQYSDGTMRTGQTVIAPNDWGWEYVGEFE